MVAEMTRTLTRSGLVAPTGSIVTWTEEIWLPGLRRLTRPAGDRLGVVLFSRVVDGLLARAAAGAGSAP